MTKKVINLDNANIKSNVIFDSPNGKILELTDGKNTIIVATGKKQNTYFLKDPNSDLIIAMAKGRNIDFSKPIEFSSDLNLDAKIDVANALVPEPVTVYLQQKYKVFYDSFKESGKVTDFLNFLNTVKTKDFFYKRLTYLTKYKLWRSLVTMEAFELKMTNLCQLIDENIRQKEAKKKKSTKINAQDNKVTTSETTQNNNTGTNSNANNKASETQDNTQNNNEKQQVPPPEKPTEIVANNEPQKHAIFPENQEEKDLLDNLQKNLDALNNLQI